MLLRPQPSNSGTLIAWKLLLEASTGSCASHIGLALSISCIVSSSWPTLQQVECTDRHARFKVVEDRRNRLALESCQC